MLETSKGFRGHLFTVVFMTLGAIAVILFLLNMSGTPITLSSAYTVKAVVPEAGSVVEGSTVTMAGVDVGAVESIARYGGGAIADIRINDRKLTPLPANSKAELEVRTPLGENYVQIVPGTSKAKLKSGGLITEQANYTYVDVDQLLSTLQNGTRAKAQQLLEGLAGGIGGKGGELNSMLAQTGSLLKNGTDITDTLVTERATIAQLVSQLGDVGGAIGERDASIQTIATQGLSALKAIASRDTDVDTIIDQLPATLTQIKQTTGTLGTVSSTATPVVADLATALTDLKPAVDNLRPAAVEGQSVVKNLAKATPPLTRTLNALKHAGPALKQVLPKVKTTVCNVNPVLKYLSPYTRDFVSFVVGLGNASDAFDGIGHTILLLPVINEESAAGLPDNVESDLQSLIQSGIVEKSLTLTYNPYPAPNQANTSFTGSTGITGPAALKASGYKYPHVTAECK